MNSGCGSFLEADAKVRQGAKWRLEKSRNLSKTGADRCRQNGRQVEQRKMMKESGKSVE